MYKKFHYIISISIFNNIYSQSHIMMNCDDAYQFLKVKNNFFLLKNSLHFFFIKLMFDVFPKKIMIIISTSSTEHK